MNTELSQLLIAKILENCGLLVGGIGVAIILIGVIKSLRAFLEWELWKGKRIDIDVVRYKLGTYLLLWLEFLVAADILETVFMPSLERIIILGSIVVIRTILNFFLNKELERIEQKELD